MKRWYSSLFKNADPIEPISDSEQELFARALWIIVRHAKLNLLPVLQLSKLINQILLDHLDPDLLTRAQLQKMGCYPSLMRKLSSNPRFSLAIPFVRQWLTTGCECREKNCSCADLQLDLVSAELLDPREDYLVYKVVNFCRHPNGQGRYDHVMAVLHMQLSGRLSKIFTSEGPKKGIQLVSPAVDGLYSGQKYNTNAAVVIGIQFFGQPKQTKQALVDYANNKGFAVSGFGGATKMRYEVGQLHVEPRAGRTRDGQKCTEGLHFFVDIDSAFNYGRAEVGSSQPIVALRLSQPRGLVMIEPIPEVKPKDPLDIPVWKNVYQQHIDRTKFAGLVNYLKEY